MDEQKKMMVGEHPVSPFGRTEAIFDDEYWQEKAARLAREAARLDANNEELRERIVALEDDLAAARELARVRGEALETAIDFIGDQFIGDAYRDSVMDEMHAALAAPAPEDARREAERRVIAAARQYVESLRKEHEAMLENSATDMHLTARLTALDGLADMVDALDAGKEITNGD